MGSFTMSSRNNSRRESLRRIKERKVRDLVGEFEHMAERNAAKPVYPDFYTQKKEPKAKYDRKWKPENLARVEESYEESKGESTETTSRGRRAHQSQNRRHKQRPRRPIIGKSLSDLSAELKKKGSNLFLQLKMHLDTNHQLKMYVLGMAALFLAKSFLFGSLSEMCHFQTLSSVAILSFFIYLLFE